MKRLWCLVLCLTLLPAVCDAGDIRFQRYGNTTKFRGNGLSGSIYHNGFGGGRIRYRETTPSYSTYEPQVFTPINLTPQYGADAPLYVPLQRAYNKPAWIP